MGAVVNLDQLFHRDLSINLCGRQSSVTQKLLYITEICSAIEQVRGERMPQAVRRNVVDVGTLSDVFVDHPANRTRGDPPSAAMQENGLLVAFGRRAFV